MESQLQKYVIDFNDSSPVGGGIHSQPKRGGIVHLSALLCSAASPPFPPSTCDTAYALPWSMSASTQRQVLSGVTPPSLDKLKNSHPRCDTACAADMEAAKRRTSEGLL